MKTDRELQEQILTALEFEPGVDAAQIGVSVKNGVATLNGFVKTFFEKQIAGRATRHVYGVRAVANDIMVRLDGGLQRSDSAIAEAVANALAWDAAVPLNTVKAVVADGWVTLSGTVEWQYQKSAAEYAVQRLFGVKGVMNSIELKPRVQPKDVKAKIESAFKRSAEVDAAKVHVETRGVGEVVLTGTVHSLSERDEAERAAWSAPGVVRVDDRIAVAP
jgi:osmotically-inducible protein OsmY